MKPEIRLFGAAIAALLGGWFNAAAQSGGPFTIDWSTIDGGGGTSTGGVYTVTGTIGQPDAGMMSGGNYTLVGGFWSVVAAIQTPGAPMLTITRTNNGYSVSWPLPATGFLLDQAGSLNGTPISWSQVPFPYLTNGTQISITVPIPTANRYYRLRKP